MKSIPRILAVLALFSNILLLADCAIAQDGPVAGRQSGIDDHNAHKYGRIGFRPFRQEEPQQDPRDTNLLDQEASQFQEMDETQDDVLEFLKRWPDKPLTEIGVLIRDPAEQFPEDRSEDLRKNAGPAPNYFVDGTFYWVAPNIYYRNLYFEDFRLERYAQTTCGPVVQPVVSSVHFFASLGLWPLRGVIPCKPTCDHPLGYLRPGLPCGCNGPNCTCGQ